jgi:hypothetical protein
MGSKGGRLGRRWRLDRLKCVVRRLF